MSDERPPWDGEVNRLIMEMEAGRAVDPGLVMARMGEASARLSAETEPRLRRAIWMQRATFALFGLSLPIYGAALVNGWFVIAIRSLPWGLGYGVAVVSTLVVLYLALFVVVSIQMRAQLSQLERELERKQTNLPDVPLGPFFAGMMANRQLTFEGKVVRGAEQKVASAVKARAPSHLIVALFNLLAVADDQSSPFLRELEKAADTPAKREMLLAAADQLDAWLDATRVQRGVIRIEEAGRD